MTHNWLKLHTFSIILLMTSLIANVYAEEILTIAASPVPQAEILKQVKPILKKQGVDLQIREFNDYIQPNLLVEQKQMDANFFQHIPYLNQFNHDRKTNLASLVAVEIEPMGIYISKTLKLAEFAASKNLTKLPKTELTIGVPNDITNEGRALLLLQHHGFIKLNPNIAYPTKKDILANPYKLKIIELDPAMLPRTLISKQLDLAVINSNYALDAKLHPLKNGVFIEDANSPYVNIIAIRADSLSQSKMKKLVNAIKSQSVTNYINQTYQGAVIPVTK